MNQTTIRVDTQTRDMLEQLKVVPQEPIDAVIRRMIDILGKGSDSEGQMREGINLLMRERLGKLHGALSVAEARAHAHTMAQGGSGRGRAGIRPRAKSARRSRKSLQD